MSGADSGKVNGTARIVLTFAVTSSPTIPLPRVAARTSRRPSYLRDIDTPSTLGSTRYVKPDTDLRMNASNSASSPFAWVLSSDCIGGSCRTCANADVGAPDTRWGVRVAELRISLLQLQQLFIE